MDRSRKMILFAGDISMLYIAGYLTLLIRFGIKQASNEIPTHILPFIIWTILLSIIFYIFNLYETTSVKLTFKNLKQFLFALSTSIVSGIMLFYLFPFSITPKTNLLLTQILFSLFILIWRRFYYNIFSKKFKNQIAFIGKTTPESEILIKNIIENPHIGYSFIGNFKNFSDLQTSKIKINTIVYTEKDNSINLEELSKSDYDYLNITKAFQIILNKIPVSLMDNEIALNILENKKNIVFNSIKRLTDIIFSITILIITLPVTIITALLIFIEDRKNIFYKQIRVGYKKKKFNIIKFRSMNINAEKNGAVWAIEKDPRTTFVGKIIRKLHIDEIPQMINILKGDISLIGPRPERPEFVEILEKEIPFYFLRQTIKPGFTGWAQIKFRYARSVVDSREKFEYDLYYINNWNLFLDLGILIKTIQIIFSH
ncbi:exopolysaccharide biosynthesis polyprenyl glycosylphosphotransferase [Candidatus Nomurabacteria bacterium]|nr:exopolysaccharide biosynthesis polyprenyl glycosylphosphotransferase [Candidatus Nomurabacteria bacterium]